MDDMPYQIVMLERPFVRETIYNSQWVRSFHSKTGHNRMSNERQWSNYFVFIGWFDKKGHEKVLFWTPLSWRISAFLLLTGYKQEWPDHIFFFNHPLCIKYLLTTRSDDVTLFLLGCQFIQIPLFGSGDFAFLLLIELLSQPDHVNFQLGSRNDNLLVNGFVERDKVFVDCWVMRPCSGCGDTESSKQPCKNSMRFFMQIEEERSKLFSIKSNYTWLSS